MPTTRPSTGPEPRPRAGDRGRSGRPSCRRPRSPAPRPPGRPRRRGRDARTARGPGGHRVRHEVVAVALGHHRDEQLAARGPGASRWRRRTGGRRGRRAARRRPWRPRWCAAPRPSIFAPRTATADTGVRGGAGPSGPRQPPPVTLTGRRSRRLYARSPWPAPIASGSWSCSAGSRPSTRSRASPPPTCWRPPTPNATRSSPSASPATAPGCGPTTPVAALAARPRGAARPPGGLGLGARAAAHRRPGRRPARGRPAAAARPTRRGRHGAGDARARRRAVRRLGRAGVGPGDGQGEGQGGAGRRRAPAGARTPCSATPRRRAPVLPSTPPA